MDTVRTQPITKRAARVKTRRRNRYAVHVGGSLDAVAVQPEEPSTPPSPGGGSVVARLRERFGHLVHEVGKFGAVGAVAFLVDLLILNALIDNDVERITAKTISTVIAASIAFIGNRFWTWRHRERTNLRREYALYFFFNAVGLGIALAVLALSHYGLGAVWPEIFHTKWADLIAAQLVGTAFGTLFRFWSYRRFVFVASVPPPEPERAPQPAADRR